MQLREKNWRNILRYFLEAHLCLMLESSAQRKKNQQMYYFNVSWIYKSLHCIFERRSASWNITFNELTTTFLKLSSSKIFYSDDKRIQPTLWNISHGEFHPSQTVLSFCCQAGLIPKLVFQHILTPSWSFMDAWFRLPPHHFLTFCTSPARLFWTFWLFSLN